jgi:FkbM family methyltransferase
MCQNNTLTNHRGLAKKIKYALPGNIFNYLRRVLNGVVSFLPYGIKYPIGNLIKRNKYPYCIIKEGDVVIQAGAPSDLLSAGRSRAIHFARFVGRGKVVVIEPDPGNCEAIKRFVARNNLQDSVILVEKGIWSEPGELDFLSSPDHPAASVLVDAKEISESLIDERHYAVIKVPVVTLDMVLDDLRIDVDSVRLVSLTTNGAEPYILKGMNKLIDGGLEYISLASTNKGYPELMEKIGYRMIAIDDRGYTFRKKILDETLEREKRTQ